MKPKQLTLEQVVSQNAPSRSSKKRNKKRRGLVWESALDTCELGDYQIVSLTNSRELGQEGRAMRNCVGGYDKMCAEGRARVFSIRDLMGNRVATMSLIFWGDNWHFEQVMGFANANVLTSEDVYYDGDGTVTQNDVTEP